MSTQRNPSRRHLLGAMLVVGSLFAQLPAEAATEVNVNNGAAVHGYDVVAYFTESKPTKGEDAYTAQHEGATYKFSSAANRDAFAANPARYAPQYGGYCAFGTAMGRKFDGNPLAWTVREDKLYLNVNAKVLGRWSKNIPGFVRGANNNWPLIKGLDDAKLEAGQPDGVTIGAQ